MSAMLGASETQFASLGKKLMQAREARGLSIEQIAKATRIRPHLLRHLEGDDFTHFSHPSYLRLYLMDYARFLEVPLQEIYDWLPDAGRPGSENYEYIAGLGAEDAGKFRQEYQYPRGNSHTLWPRIFRGVLVLAVICLGVVLVNLVNNLKRIGGADPTAQRAAAEEVVPAPVETAAVEVPVVEVPVPPSAEEAKIDGVPDSAFSSVAPVPEAPAAPLEEQQANLSLTSPTNPTPAGSQVQ